MKKKKAPGTVITIILTAITTLFWAAYSTYQAIRTLPEFTVEEKLLIPFNPNLDTETLDKLPLRVYFEESQIPENAIQQLVETEVEEEPLDVEPTPSPTPVAESEEQSEATESGQL